MNIQQSTEDIARRALELSNELYTNKSIKPYSPELSEKIAGYNRIYQGDFNFGRVRWLVAAQSSGGDFGINRGGIDYLLGSLQEQRIIAGVVVLMAKREAIGKMLVTDVWARIEHARWLDGNGEFCWIDKDFIPVNRDRDRDRYIVVDPDAPM